MKVSPSRTLPLARLRGVIRPVVVAGSRGHIMRSLKAARSYYEPLRERGICIIPLVTLEGPDPAEKIRALKLKAQGIEEGDVSSKGFSEENKEAQEADSKWELSPHNTGEWLVRGVPSS